MSLAMLQYRFDSLKTSFEIGCMKMAGEALYAKNMARVSLGIKGKDKSVSETDKPISKEDVVTDTVQKNEKVIERVEGEIIDVDDIKIKMEEISSEPAGNQLSLVVRRLSDDEVEIIDPVYDPVFLTDDELDEFIEEAYKFVRGDGNQIKLTILSTFYMANIIKPEQMFSRCKNDNDLVTINSIVKFYSGIPALPQFSTLSINEVISIGLLKSVVEFEANYEMVVDNDSLYEVIMKTEELITAYNKANLDISAGDQDPGIPVFFTARNMNLTGHHGVSKAEIKKLEKELGDLLANYAYQFNKNGDLIELVIHGSDRMDSYYIDPGVMIGNGFNVICNVPGDTIMVNQRHKDILAKVFENPLYCLNQEEIMRVSMDMFMNPRIYYMLDMSKGPEFLPKLSEEEFAKLGKKLSFILNIPWNPNELPFGRMRFRGFKSVDDFTLVSDDKCKSPLSGNDETCGFISPGLVVKVNGDKVVVKNETATKEFTITEYNEM